MSDKLVVFFTRRGENYAVGNISEGNAEHIAKVIRKILDADIVEIKPKHEYSSDYNACVKKAGEELKREERPEIIDCPENLDGYNDVYLCYPNWWGTFPRPVATFLEKYDLSGKNIWPMCTHEGSAMGSSEAELKRILKNSNIKKGLAIKGTEARNSDEKIKKWLES